MILNIIIVNWGSGKVLSNCLSKLIDSEDVNFRIIVVNNFSTNENLYELRNIYKDFQSKCEIYLVENDKNRGYAGGNNEGYYFIKKNNFSGDILVLNPDVLINRDTLNTVCSAISNKIGILSIRTLDTNGKILYDALKLKGFIQKNIICDKSLCLTDYSQGSFMLIKREIIEAIGFFDERYFLYWEDTDFSIRAKKWGAELFSITTSSIIREKNIASREPNMFYYSLRNSRLIKSKFPSEFSNLQYLIYIFYIFTLNLKNILRPLLFISVFFSTIAGLKDSLNNKYNIRLN
jgi:GT2 family glycosyltransferase